MSLTTPEEFARLIQDDMLDHEHLTMVAGPGCYSCEIVTDDFPAHEAQSIAALIEARDKQVRADALRTYRQAILDNPHHVVQSARDVADDIPDWIATFVEPKPVEP